MVAFVIDSAMECHKQKQSLKQKEKDMQNIVVVFVFFSNNDKREIKFLKKVNIENVFILRTHKFSNRLTKQSIVDK